MEETQESVLKAPSLAEQLSTLLTAEEVLAVRRFVAGLEPVDTVHVVSQLADDERAKLIRYLRPEAAADVLEHLPEVQAGEALESIHPARAARILNELPSDGRADLLNEIEEEDAEAGIRMRIGTRRNRRRFCSRAVSSSSKGGNTLIFGLYRPGDRPAIAPLSTQLPQHRQSIIQQIG
jgi:Mg/Co/Ni transporter MgtE